MLYAPGKELGCKEAARHLRARACDFACAALTIAAPVLRELLPNDVVEYIDPSAAWLTTRNNSKIGIFLNKTLPERRLALTARTVYRQSIARKRFKSFGKFPIVEQPFLNCAPNARHQCVRPR